MAHHKHFGVGLAHCPIIKPESPAVEPTRAGFHVVPERQPQALELADFPAVLAVPQVDDVRNAHGLEMLHMAPGGYRAAKRQPLAYPKHLHAVASFVRT